MARCDDMEAFLSTAISGALVGQIAAKREIPIEDFMEENSGLLHGVCDELEELGIYPPLIARSTLIALSNLLAQDQNIDIVTKEFAQLLWSILGNPESGGEKPPAIYYKAARAVHLVQVGFLNPLIEP